MNLELLKKLTRLANNNPNDNEANLAARKVAKMLQDNNWSLPANNSASSNESRGYSFTEKNNDDLHIIITRRFLLQWPKVAKLSEQLRQALKSPGAGTWEDIVRSEEPIFRSKPPTEHEQAKYNEEHYKRWRDIYEQSYYKKYAKQYEPSSWDIPYEFKGGQRDDKKTKEKRKLKCTRCGQERDTAYVGNLYVCIECYWKEYNDKRGEATG